MEEVKFLEQEKASFEQPKSEVDWAESEWFKNWLRLARRDYHGQIKQSERKGHRHH